MRLLWSPSFKRVMAFRVYFCFFALDSYFRVSSILFLLRLHLTHIFKYLLVYFSLDNILWLKNATLIFRSKMDSRFFDQKSFKNFLYYFQQFLFANGVWMFFGESVFPRSPIGKKIERLELFMEISLFLYLCLLK